MAERPLSRINEGEHNGWEKLTGKQGNSVSNNSLYAFACIRDMLGPDFWILNKCVFYDNLNV